MTRLRAHLSTCALLAIAGAATLLAACSEGNAPAPAIVKAAPFTEAKSWTECQASDQAWVRRATLAIEGRKSWGQAEVNAYEDLTAASSRDVLARAMMTEDYYRLHWSDVFMDALHVVRMEDKSQKSCYGAVSGAAFDDGSLAAWVRDHDASDSGSPMPGFTMRQLMNSALVIDDLSVVYRAHLFAMVARPLYGANLDDVGRELSRRQDFGGVFDATYIHRNLVCLGCHNSESSVTYDPDPTKNRAWPMRGLFEQSLFGASNGTHPAAEDATAGTDFLRAHSMLRYSGVADDTNGAAPYGWSGDACGVFGRPTDDPLLGVDTYFGSIRGQGASVWDLEASLHRGVDKLAAHGLTFASGDLLADSDEAFAYLVGANIVEQVWSETMGGPLTIANDFPRNQVDRDTLSALTAHFVANHFSLKTLLGDIVAHPAFNLLPPSATCGGGPYDLPNLFDPWTTASTDPDLRGNGGGDAVFAISSRPLVRSLHHAMEWPYLDEYPLDPTFDLAVGFFMKDADPGYRGFDFQGRLTWETAYGACAERGVADFVARIVATAATVPGATLGDGVIALKDRLIGEPRIGDAEEAAVLEALLAAPLSAIDPTKLDARLRTACGVFISSPQFLFGGSVPDDTRAVPTLTPIEHSYAASCDAIAPALASIGYVATCGESSVRVAASR